MKNIQTDDLLKQAVAFGIDRNWGQYHTIKNFISALQIEASELAEVVLWKKVLDKEELTEEEMKEMGEEVADVFIYLLLLTNKLGLDLEDETRKKILKNIKKYPIEKCSSEFKKHTKL